MTGIPNITDLQRYNYQPGDTLIVIVNRPPTRWEVDNITEAVRDALGLPDLPVLVHGPDASIQAINLDAAHQPAERTAAEALQAVRDSARELMAIDPTAKVTISRGVTTQDADG